MKNAKYYIYWNLHRNVYSVRLRGRVVAHCENILATNVTFQVSEPGRQRVLKERRKNVHAFVIADSFTDLTEIKIGRAHV